MTTPNAELIAELERMQSVMNLAAYRPTIARALRTIQRQADALAASDARVAELEAALTDITQPDFMRKYCELERDAERFRYIASLGAPDSARADACVASLRRAIDAARSAP